MGGGGAPLQPDLVDKIDKSLDDGRARRTGYGLTETHGIVTANSARLYVAKPASCGRVVPTLDAKLVDERRRRPARRARTRSASSACAAPVVIKGYLNRPEATAEAIRDGWFHTGDIARIDEDGFVFIVDRAKDMVLRGGENVYCSEVEAAIYEHRRRRRGGRVRRARRAARRGRRRRGRAARRRHARPPTTCSAFLADRIAKHKIPATIWFRDEPLPRNANGKFLKRELRAELLGPTRSSVGAASAASSWRACSTSWASWA